MPRRNPRSRTAAAAASGKAQRKPSDAPKRRDERPASGRTALEGDRLYRSLFETSPDGMLLARADTGTVIRTNRALTALSGYPAKALLGARLWEIPPLRATDAGLVAYRELRKQRQIYYDDLPFETRDRGRITIEMTCTAHTADRTGMILCTFRDATSQQRIKEQLLVAEARFRVLFQQAGIGIALLDRSGRFLESNAKLQDMLGYAGLELTDLRYSDIIVREGPDAPQVPVPALLTDLPDGHHAAHRCRRKNGSLFWALLTISSIRTGKTDAQFLILTLEDISDRKRAEEAVVDSRDYYRALLYELPNPIRITDPDSLCEYVNKTWIDFTGRKLEQEIGEGWLRGIHPEDLQRVKETCSISMRDRSPYSTEYRLAHRGGGHRWIMEFGRPYTDLDKHFAGYISSCYDVHERKMFEDRLHEISLTDELTGLLNRRGFFTFAQQQIKIANRSGTGFLFLYADLDGLKNINDTLGHQEGDAALIEVAHILREVFRESDLLSRIGGDEFAVLMMEKSVIDDEHAILDRLQASIRAHNDRPGRRFRLSLSCGIKQYDPSAPCSLDELITRADRLMYREKKEKRAR